MSSGCINTEFENGLQGRIAGYNLADIRLARDEESALDQVNY